MCEGDRQAGGVCVCVWIPTSVSLPLTLPPSSNEPAADGTPSVSPLPSFFPSTPLSSLFSFTLYYEKTKE